MPARNPVEIDTLFVNALNAGDLDALIALYEPQAAQLSLTGPDGKPATMSGKSVEVVRRQPDGRWLFAIDFPFGADAAA